MVLSVTMMVPVRVEAGTVANVLVYAGPGSWGDGITAFENFLTYKGLTYQEQSYSYINNNDLRGKFDVIYFPGGDAYQYDRRINSAGDNNIRNFVSNGGGYIGICAGAYFACDRILWEGGWQYYTLDLFMGYGYGAIDSIIPWSGYTMTWTTMNLANPLCTWELTKEYQMYYGGGAYYPDAGQSMNVIATYDSYNNDPAMINFGYGSGHVVMFGPHPEIEEDDTRDGTAFGDQFEDLGTDWNIMWTCMDYLRNVPITQPPGTIPPDEIPPVINWVSDSPDPSVSGNPVTITAEVVDNVGVGDVWVNVLGNNYPMTAIGNDQYQYTMSTAGGSTEVLFDGFEGTWGWTVAGTGALWAKSTASAYQGSYSAYVKQTGVGKVTTMTKTISTVGYTGITLTFYRKVVGFDVTDEYKAEWSDGTNWYVLEQSGSGSMNDGSYVLRTYNLPTGANNNPNLKLRFSADCGAVSEWASIDNVRLVGTGSGMSPGTYGYTVYAEDLRENQATPVAGEIHIV